MNRQSSDISLRAVPGEPASSELMREMRRQWRDGERTPAEVFFARDPSLSNHPEAAVDLVYEEFCLRAAQGEQGCESDILRRFPQWAGALEVMFDCHRRLIETHHDQPRFPGVGDRLGDFRLVSELARGSRGRVFLANEAALGDRLAVLKITPLDECREHLSLARLQHTNVVPLYSVFDDSVRGVRILCMPYFGRATLAALLEALTDIPVQSRTGGEVVPQMDALTVAGTPTKAIGGAARQMLEQVSYVQAMCWIAACLADALQFAHERGVVHLDLKPSNILLATDGQPMLLDFHLARAPVRAGEEMPEHFGGTRPYMPPEQLLAMESLQNGRPVEMDVDARADIYTLGAIVFESLCGGRLADSGDVVQLASINPAVSVGLCDIIAKCVEPKPNDRYQDAGAVAIDLRRHLTDQPLVGVPNRRIAERWSKWRRRRPGAMRTGGTIALVCAMLVVLIIGGLSMIRGRERQADLALADSDRLIRAGHFGEGITSLERALRLIEPLPFQRPRGQQLRERLATARRMSLAAQLHELADEIRVTYGIESIRGDRLDSLATQCDVFWSHRNALLDSLQETPDRQLIADLQDIAIFAADVQARHSPHSPAAALQRLDETEAAFGASPAMDHARNVYRVSAGLTSASPSAREVRRQPATASEQCALGRAYLASGDLPRAMQELSAARRQDPAGQWSNFYYGVCAYRMGRYVEAVEAFSICIGVVPTVAAHFYNRGLASNALGRTDEALADLDRALTLEPSHILARVAHHDPSDQPREAVGAVTAVRDAASVASKGG